MTVPDDVDRRHLDAFADPFPYWFDDVDEPQSNPTLVRNESCDLCVVGGGYTGLWTAIVAKERDPSRDVVLIDAAEIGSVASGRNGGFMESSLTHGIANGQERFPDEIELLEQLGRENLDAIEKTPSTATPSTATSSAPASSMWRRRRTLPATSTSCATTPYSCGGSVRTPAGWTVKQCVARSIRPRTSVGCGASAGRRWSTRRGSPGV